MKKYDFVQIDNSAIEKINDFNRMIHGDEVKDAAHALRSHPLMKDEYYIALQNEIGEIVCAVMLLPVMWNYCGAVLRGAELAIMGTHPDYRNKGLASRVVGRLFELCERDGFMFSSITGIPEFYLRFGYSYAFELDNDVRMPVCDCQMRDDVEMAKAGPQHSEYLTRMYAQMMGGHDVFAQRDEKLFSYIMNLDSSYCFHVERYIMRCRGNDRGYLGISPVGFGEGLIVQELFCEDETLYDDVIAYCSALAVSRQKNYIRLNISSHSQAMRYLRRRGAVFHGSYSYYLKIISAHLLLESITPVLEVRLAASSYANYSGSFTIGFYTAKAVELIFKNGKLVGVTETNSSNIDVIIPWPLLADLVFGVRSFEELRIKSSSFSGPDPFCVPGSGSLARVLFPVLRCYAHWAY